MQLFLALQLLFGDKLRLNKQILEAGQVASTAIWQNRDSWPLPANARLYKPAYVRHPVTMWAYESERNTIFTIDYLFSLERKRRELYGSAIHGTCVALEALKSLGTGTYIDSEEELIKYCLQHNITIPIVVPIEGVNLEAIDKRTKEVTLANIHERLNLHKIYLGRKHRGLPAPKPKKKPKIELLGEGEEVKTEPEYEVAPGALTEADLKVLGEQAQLDLKLLQAVRVRNVKTEPLEVQEDVKVDLVVAQEDLKPAIMQKKRIKKKTQLRKEAIDVKPKLDEAQLDQKPVVRNTRSAYNISAAPELLDTNTKVRKRASETQQKQQEPPVKRIKVERGEQAQSTCVQKQVNESRKSGGKSVNKSDEKSKKGNADKPKQLLRSKNSKVENSIQTRSRNGSGAESEQHESKSKRINPKVQEGKGSNKNISTTVSKNANRAKSSVQDAKSGNGEKSKTSAKNGNKKSL